MSGIHDEFFEVFDQGNWFLASQNIVALKDQSVWGAEILIRLYDGDRFLANGKFFPGICRDERYPRITQQIVDLLSRHLDIEPQSFEPRVFLNVTPTDFSNAITVEKLASLATKFAQNDRQLVLELSEIFTVEELHDCVGSVTKFRNLGVIIALDDYGTGVIRAKDIDAFPFDLVKSDRSLCGFREGWESPYHSELMKVSQNKSLILLAEGIEDSEFAADLMELGYQYGQGFCFDMPSKFIERA